MFICHFIALLTIGCTHIVFLPQSNDHRNIPIMVTLNQVPFIHLKFKHKQIQTRVSCSVEFNNWFDTSLLVNIMEFNCTVCNKPYGCRLILLLEKQ